MTALWVWLALAAIFVIIEVLTLDLIFLNLALGAVGGGVAQLFWPLPGQILVAAVVAMLGLAFLRPVALRHLRKTGGEHQTNVDALIGLPVRVLATVSETNGLASVKGEQWSARVSPGAPVIHPGAPATVASISGAYLILTTQPS